jgi:hypothetical protein
VRTPDGHIQIGDVSNAGPVGTIKRGDKDVRVWTNIWYPLASDGTGWHNALRTGYLTGPIAAHVAALSLHHFDISFCQRIMKEYHLKFVSEYNDVSLALWIAVLTKFMSCFQKSEARPQLDQQDVYRGNPTALDDFKLLKDLRNKHVAHDENSHYNAAAFAWLEPNGDGDVRVVGPYLIVARIDPTLVTTMCNLVGHALDFINIALAKAGKDLLTQVQAMTPEERMALPTGVYFPLPTEDDIKQARWTL